MGFLHRLKLQYRPPRLADPDFGPLVFMYFPNAPASSYWEAEWLFPPTGNRVSIMLPGPESGPLPEARAFYLALPARFDAIIDAVRQPLGGVFKVWYDRPIREDLWQDVSLAGFDLTDPRRDPVEWEVSFETKGDRWLGITIPFAGDLAAGDPIVDT